MVHMLGEARKIKGAVLLHVITQKGKGYAPAERHPARFHGAEPFDIETGIPSKPQNKANYTDIFSTVMCKLGQREECGGNHGGNAGWYRIEAFPEYASGSVF